MAETPEERKKRLLAQLEKGRATRAKNAALRKKAEAEGDTDTLVKLKPKPKAKSLSKVIRDILDDDEIVDKVIQNQPEYWKNLPHKNPSYIIATVMAVKAMGGDIKAAEFIAKRGWGDKVVVDSEQGFFAKTDFTIQVVPSKQIDSGIDSSAAIEGDIKQIEE